VTTTRQSRDTRSARARAPGFSLLELLIAMSIMATLTAVALPGLRHFVLRAHRFEAREALLSLAAAQERHYLEHHAYADAAALARAPPQGLGIAATTANGRYSIAIEPGADAGDFVATATATGSQAADSECASLSVDSAGQRRALSRSGVAATRCWD
jgi:type IV pilus assembly protein PilE